MKFNNTDVAIPSVLTYKLNELNNKIPIIPEIDDKITFKENNNNIVEYSLNGSSKSEFNFNNGLGITLEKITNGIKINTESHHTVISKEVVVTSQYNSNFSETTVKCDLYGEKVRIVNLNDFGATKEIVDNTFIWNKEGITDEDIYAGILYASSTDGTCIFELEMNDKIYLYGVIFDTPDNATFCFATTCLLPIQCQYENNNLYGYLKIPKEFIGNIKVRPLTYYTRSGSNFGCFTTDKKYSWLGSNENVTMSFCQESQLTGEAISSEIVNNRVYGHYGVDIVCDLGPNIEVNDKISDNIINDYFIHNLNDKVNYLIEKLNQTTI